MAQEHCDAINKYDKLRFVIELDTKHKIIAIFDFLVSDLEKIKKSSRVITYM